MCWERETLGCRFLAKMIGVGESQEILVAENVQELGMTMLGAQIFLQHTIAYNRGILMGTYCAVLFGISL